MKSHLRRAAGAGDTHARNCRTRERHRRFPHAARCKTAVLLPGDRTPLDTGYCPETRAVMSTDLNASGTNT
jgi:hypothetical protein